MKILAIIVGLLVLLPLISLPVNADAGIIDYGPKGTVANPYIVENGDTYTIWATVSADTDSVRLYEKLAEDTNWKPVYTDWTFDANVNEMRYYQIVAVDEGHSSTTAETVILIVPRGDGENHAPTAEITSPASGSTHDENTLIKFKGIGADTDIGDVITKYAWTFGDGKIASGSEPTHTYSDVNSKTEYTVGLRVSDGKDWSEEVTIEITIKDTDGGEDPDNLAPTAKFTMESTVLRSDDVPFTVDFSFSANDPGEGGKIKKYTLNFADGSDEISEDNIINQKTITRDRSDNSELRHTYETPGSYTVVLTVTDYEGLEGKATMYVVVNEKGSYYYDRPDGGRGSGTGGTGTGGVSDGALVLDYTHITLEAGEDASIPFKVMNFGNKGAEFEISVESASFGSARASPDDFYVGAKNDMRSYIKLHADDGAEGSYILRINLLKDGEVVDSTTIYVTVEDSTSAWAVFGMVALLIVALAGVAGLAYLVYTENTKRKEKSAQVKLEKYY